MTVEKDQDAEEKLANRQPDATASVAASALPSAPPRPSGLPPLRPNVPLIEQIGRPAIPIQRLILPVPAVSPGIPDRKILSSAARPTRQKLAKRETEVMCIGCRNLFLTGQPFDKHVKKCKPLDKLLRALRVVPKVPEPFPEVPLPAESSDALTLADAQTIVFQLEAAQDKLEAGLRHQPAEASGTSFPADYRERMIRQHGEKWVWARIDESRFRLIESLRPSRCFAGTEYWDGYFVFEFPWTPRVVLESALTRNATYIISGNWKEAMGRRRSAFKTELRLQCQRIPHQRDWFRDVRNVLGFKRLYTGFLRRYGSGSQETQMAVEPLGLPESPTVAKTARKAKLAVEPRTPAEALKGVKIQKVPFEIMPPGTWDIEYLIDRCRRAAKSTESSSMGRVLQVERLRKLVKLHPATCHVGTGEWDGYVVLEFPNSPRVVLECPYAGNATYILSGNWQRQLRHTKLYIRMRSRSFRTRVFHRGDWLARIRDALQ